MIKCRCCNNSKKITDFRYWTVKKSGKTYRRKTCISCEKELNAKWREANPSYGKEWYSKNRDKMLLVNKKYAEVHKERLKCASKQWELNNRDKCRAKRAKRRSVKLNASVDWADHDKINSFYSLANRLSKWLGAKFHVDHIIPLINSEVCGLHNEFNLQVLTQTENSSKSNKFNPKDFTEVQTKERQQMNKYFNLDQTVPASDDTLPDDGTDTGGDTLPPKKPVGG